MQIHEFDVIKTKDGKEGTVVDLLDQGKAFLVEITDREGRTLEFLTLRESDISSVIWKYTQQ